MSSLQTIIVYAIAIVAFYTLILWFIHKASAYFKKLDDAISNSFKEPNCDESITTEPVDESASLTTEETIEYLKNQERASHQIEVAENK